MKNRYTLSAAQAGHKLSVNRAAGTITGLSLVTANGEAKGHGLFIDGETLNTALKCIKAAGGRLKCAIKHLSYGETDRVTEFPGWFESVFISGSRLIAGKLEFYDDFKTGDATKRLFSRLIEMAEKTPDLFGLSLEAYGYAVYVAEDGTEYSKQPYGVPLRYNGVPAMRCVEVTYAAFVDNPAANPKGLFGAFAAGLNTTSHATLSPTQSMPTMPTTPTPDVKTLIAQHGYDGAARLLRAAKKDPQEQARLERARASLAKRKAPESGPLVFVAARKTARKA